MMSFYDWMRAQADAYDRAQEGHMPFKDEFRDNEWYRDFWEEMFKWGWTRDYPQSVMAEMERRAMERQQREQAQRAEQDILQGIIAKREGSDECG